MRKMEAVRIFAGALGLVCLMMTGTLRAQAPPGPLPQVQSKDAPPPAQEARPKPQLRPRPRQSILGAWKLNRDDSDDPREKLREARGNSSQNGYGRRGGAGYPGGGGYPGSGRGGYGGGRSGSEEERRKMQEIFEPAHELTLSMTGAEVDLTDDDNRKRALMTDGRKLQKSKDPAYEEIAAHWTGSRLVTDEKDGRGNKISREFELAAGGQQLYETIHMTVGRNNANVIIRYVYDQAPDKKS
jgi:hypothetical protein